jgi:carbonic anhydrase/acetyltransferase-like protein (isoleucine patch superfamily)
MATVSPSAYIGEGTVVEMKAIIGTGARVGRGCIISSGAVVDLNASVGEYVHVGSAAAVKKDAVVSPFSVITAARFSDIFEMSMKKKRLYLSSPQCMARTGIHKGAFATNWVSRRWGQMWSL